MGWIDIEDSLPSHRKTLEVADDLGVEPVLLVGHLTCFWLWATNNADNAGLLPEGIRPKTIARVAYWAGDADTFIGALVGRFIDQVEDGRLRIHDWDQHFGKWAERRERETERKREWRSQQQPVASRGQDADSPRDGVVTVPDLTVPDLTESTDSESHVDSHAREGAREGRGPDEPSARAAPGRTTPNGVIERDGRRFLPGTGWIDDPPADESPPLERIHPEVQQCPLCGEPFLGDYGSHLEASPRHKVGSEPRRPNPGRVRGAVGKPPPEVQAELARMERDRPSPEDVAAELARIAAADPAMARRLESEALARAGPGPPQPEPSTNTHPVPAGG